MTGKILKIKDKQCILDEEDFYYYSQWKWQINNSGYVRRTLKQAGKPDKTVYLHRLIMMPPIGKEIDHINGNKLDNRKSNLRICNRSNNMLNSKKRIKKCSSKYKYVYWNKTNKRWNVEVGEIWGGAFKDEKLAGIRANELIKELHGEFAKLNIIESE